MSQPTAEDALRRLEPLVGEWTFEARWPDGEPWPGGGRVTFEWPRGRTCSSMGRPSFPRRPTPSPSSDAMHRTGPTSSCTPTSGGVCRVYQMSIGNREWKLWREGEPFSQRFSATFSDDGNTITGRWEIAEDGTDYATDFDLICRRVDTGAMFTRPTR
jgi:hypothetical protein